MRTAFRAEPYQVPKVNVNIANKTLITQTNSGLFKLNIPPTPDGHRYEYCLPTLSLILGYSEGVKILYNIMKFFLQICHFPFFF